MRFTTILLAGSILLACCGLGNPQAHAAAYTTRTGAFNSTVQVIVSTRFGTTRKCSGYLFTTQGLVLTNYHAITDAVRIQVFQADLGVLDIGRVRRVDPQRNLAILGIAQALNPELPLAYPAETRDYQPGEKLHVLHHAQYRDELLSEVSVEAAGLPSQFPGSTFAKAYVQDAPLIRVRGPFDAGSAGGIVCDEAWNVAGVLVGSEPGSSGTERSGYVLLANYFAPLLQTSYDTEWSELRTGATSDASEFARHFGPAAPAAEFQSAMDGGYVAWFSRIYPCSYADAEFTTEINDIIKKNWFYADELVIDHRPLREWSGSRVVVWGAGVNPWNLSDNKGRYMHFDADAIFNKRVYKTRTTEERIMTRYILAMELSPGPHTIQYQNKAANFKSSGLKRQQLNMGQGLIAPLDIQGLSLVQMDVLPAPQAGIGEGAPVKYTLTRRPLGSKELGFGIRSARFKLRP
jgi:hypothetical protein